MEKLSEDKINKFLPNCITLVRITGTVCLLFTVPFSMIFYLIYTICGLSDVLDGTIARATGNVSESGAKLDSIADLMFYSVMLIKVFPVLWHRLPVEIWYGVGMILLIRLASYITAALKFHRFASCHTYLNKLTGAAVFAVPYLMLLSNPTPFCIAVCVIAGAASAEELMIHLTADCYRPDRKALWKS